MLTLFLIFILAGDSSRLLAPPLGLDPQPSIELSATNRLIVKNNPELLREEERRNVIRQEERSFPWPGILALSAALVLLFTAKKRGKGDLFQPIQEEPKKRALRRLHTIQESSLQADQLYQALTQLVRQYLEETYQIRATTQTTEEFLQTLSKESQFKYETRAALSLFLEVADAVKFGQYQPSKEEKEEAVKATKNVINF